MMNFSSENLQVFMTKKLNNFTVHQINKIQFLLIKIRKRPIRQTKKPKVSGKYQDMTSL